MDDLRIKYIKAISEAKDEDALEDVRLAALEKKRVLFVARRVTLDLL